MMAVHPKCELHEEQSNFIMIWTEITLNKSPSNRARGEESQMGSILYQIQWQWKVLGSGE